jgi:hypothetical protein
MGVSSEISALRRGTLGTAGNEGSYFMATRKFDNFNMISAHIV